MSISPIRLTVDLPPLDPSPPPAEPALQHAKPAAPASQPRHPKTIELERNLEELRAKVEVADLRNLDEPDSIKAKLKEFNLRILREEASIRHLENIEKELCVPNLTAVNALFLFLVDLKRQSFKGTHKQALQEKIEFIKKNVKSENRVYAMAIPHTLKKGTSLCTCNTYKKINTLLFSRGFSFCQEDPHWPATFYSEEFQNNPRYRAPNRLQKQEGNFHIANTYGEFGYYFSVGKPEYLGLRGSELGFSCLLKKDQEGVTIPSCRWLDPQRFSEDENEIDINFEAFSPAEIEKGYLQIQMNYPFLRADDRPTITVFTNPQGNMEITNVFWGKDQDHIEKRKSLDEYIKSGEADRDNPVKGLTAIHPTWNGVLVRPQVKCQIKPTEAGSANLVDLQIVPNPGGPLTIFS